MPISNPMFIFQSRIRTENFGVPHYWTLKASMLEARAIGAIAKTFNIVKVANSANLIQKFRIFSRKS